MKSLRVWEWLSLAFGISLLVDRLLVRVLLSVVVVVARKLHPSSMILHSLVCFLLSNGAGFVLAQWLIVPGSAVRWELFSLLLLWNAFYRTLVGYLAPGNFTIAESSVLTSFLAVCFLDAYLWTFHRPSAKQPLTMEGHRTWMVYHLLQAMILGMLLIGLLHYPLLQYIRRVELHARQQEKPRKRSPRRTMVLSALFYCSVLAFVFLVIRPWVIQVVGVHGVPDKVVDPFEW